MQPSELLQNLKRRGFNVYLDGGRLAVSPARFLDNAEKELIQTYKSRLLQILASDMAWPDAGDDPVLQWCHAVRRGMVELPISISFRETPAGVVVVEPTEYILDKLDRLRWIRSSIATGGIGDWTPAWFTAQAERLRANLRGLKNTCESG